MSNAFLIRPARVDDADAIARVHHRSWEETYPGLMPPELLERVSLDDRLTLWRKIIHEHPAGVARLVATVTEETTPTHAKASFASGVAAPQKIVGVATCGPAREKELGARWEIHMVYVLREAQRIGVGTALMRVMVDHLAALSGAGSHEDRSVGLWVLKGNDNAIRFYEKHGFAQSGTIKRDERHGVVIEDVGMRWEMAPL